MPSLNNVGKLRYAAAPIVGATLGTASAFVVDSDQPLKRRGQTALIYGTAGAIGGLGGAELLRLRNARQIKQQQAFIDELSTLLAKSRKATIKRLEEAGYVSKAAIEAEKSRYLAYPEISNHLKDSLEQIKQFSHGSETRNLHLGPVAMAEKNLLQEDRRHLIEMEKAYSTLSWVPASFKTDLTPLKKRLLREEIQSIRPPLVLPFEHVRALINRKAFLEEHKKYKKLLETIPEKKRAAADLEYSLKRKVRADNLSPNELSEQIKHNTRLRKYIAETYR